jgi:photosystem II stability/assembly factor-like uncharacterized protein
MQFSRLLRLGLAAAACAGCSTAAETGVRAPESVVQASGTNARLQAVSAVSGDTAWVSGVAGTYGRTIDGGRTWQTGVVPGADTLQFRDVHAVSADTAYLLSAGTGAASQIFKTVDGGITWMRQWVNTIPDAFFDCFAFWDSETGIAFSDAVDGAFVILRTEDGAEWAEVPVERVPPALDGEGSFASSGTCVVAVGDSAAWIGTGNGERARVLRTSDRGHSWSISETPVVAGAAAGIASVAVRGGMRGVIAGGEIGDPGAVRDRMASTEDGGQTWHLMTGPPFAGAVYGASYARSGSIDWLVVVGPGGASASPDDGSTWLMLDSLGYWGLDFVGRSGWITGPDGRVLRLRFD